MVREDLAKLKQSLFSEKKAVRNIVTEFSAAQDILKPKIKYQTIFSYLGLKNYAID